MVTVHDSTVAATVYVAVGAGLIHSALGRIETRQERVKKLRFSRVQVSVLRRIIENVKETAINTTLVGAGVSAVRVKWARPKPNAHLGTHHQLVAPHHIPPVADTLSTQSTCQWEFGARRSVIHSAQVRPEIQ